MLQKKVPRQSQISVYTGLFTGREAPGEAGSRAHCTNKKQLFEQHLKHFSKILQKKVNWIRNQCKKLKNLVEKSELDSKSVQKTGLQTKLKIMLVI